MVERYLRRRAGGGVLAHESAADLAQSVCREALERLRRGDLEYRGEAQLRQWLFGAADLKVRNRRRYYGADKRHGGDGELPEDTLCARDPSPSSESVRSEDQRAFERALSELDERQREAIRLFHLEARGHAEVALALGVSEENSRVIVARALARLARILRARP